MLIVKNIDSNIHIIIYYNLIFFLIRDTAQQLRRTFYPMFTSTVYYRTLTLLRDLMKLRLITA